MSTPEERRLARNASAAAWRARNPGAQSLANKQWALKYPEKVKARNRGRDPKYSREYFAKRVKVDPLFKLGNNLRHLVYGHFKLRGWSKTSKTQALLGCTFEEFVTHLQSKFEEGMTLENHGDWHIDHIKPCATATSAEELAALFHFTNLQPLWATENLSKGCKYHE